MPTRDEQIHALHRYFIWANRMRDHMTDTFESQGMLPDRSEYPPEMSDDDVDQHANAWLMPIFLYMSMWLSMLNVVVEGWRAIGVKDPNVDPLLIPSFLDTLRRYRNAAFHYQPDYYDERIRKVLLEPDFGAHKHAHLLHDAFSHYFLVWKRGRAIDVSPEVLAGLDECIQSLRDQRGFC